MRGEASTERQRAAPAGAVTLYAGMTELIVGGTLLAVAQDFVRFLGFLEMMFGVLVVRVAIRMIFHGEAPVGLLDLGLPRIFADTQYFVVIPLRHEFDFD